MRPKKKSPETPPAIRFYNRAASDPRVVQDIIRAQVYNPERAGYGQDLTVQQLQQQAADDPALQAELSKFFGPAVDKQFAKRFQDDVNFARIYAPIEGGRQANYDVNAITPKFKGKYKTKGAECGEPGAGSSIACDPGKAKEIAKERNKGGVSALDPLIARLQGMQSGASKGSVPQESLYQRYGSEVPDDLKQYALMSGADRNVAQLMNMLGYLPGQGQNVGVMQPRHNISF